MVPTPGAWAWPRPAPHGRPCHPCALSRCGGRHASRMPVAVGVVGAPAAPAVLSCQELAQLAARAPPFPVARSHPACSPARHPRAPKGRPVRHRAAAPRPPAPPPPPPCRACARQGGRLPRVICLRFAPRDGTRASPPNHCATSGLEWAARSGIGGGKRRGEGGEKETAGGDSERGSGWAVTACPWLTAAAARHGAGVRVTRPLPAAGRGGGRGRRRRRRQRRSGTRPALAVARAPSAGGHSPRPARVRARPSVQDAGWGGAHIPGGAATATATD